MKIGIIGLGKMGTGLALQALEKGIEVAGLTRGKPSEELLSHGLKPASNFIDLIGLLDTPRKIFLYIPAGPAVDQLLVELSKHLDPGDIILDGGNSYWGDSRRRFGKLLEKQIHLLDLGTSGGMEGAREGASFMVGGERSAYDEVESVLKTLSTQEGCAYVGPSGCGHLVKLIHNGIEFGMLQAIGEGMALLEKFREQLPIEMNEVFKVYRHGSVIRSWLIDLMARQYRENNGFTNIPPFIEDTGEVNWLLSDAIHLEVPLPVIGQSITELFRSRDKKHIDYRSIALMRHGFGGHPFGPKKELEIERNVSRVNPDFPEIKHEH